MGEYFIRTDNICKSFHKKKVLHDVSMAIPKGSIYGLLGPSGCGKTTFVKILAGILKKDSGEAFVGGNRIPSAKILGTMGYMAQSAALYPTLSAYENLKFFGSLYKLSGSALKDRIAYVAELVHLTEDLQKKVAEYSGGMCQRLSLAICLLAEPSFLLLDEPTVGIDPVLRKEIWKELRRLADGGVTILITTHVMDEAEKCDLLGMMRDGQLLASDTPKEILAKTGCQTMEDAFIALGSGMFGGDFHEN